jgi:hypothetical protein
MALVSSIISVVTPTEQWESNYYTYILKLLLSIVATRTVALVA